MANAMSVADRIVRSRIRMLVEYPFFGVLSLGLIPKETGSVATAATDGRYYYYNPSFIGGLDDQEINFITCHEVLHPALGHLWRRGTRDDVIWNAATDYVINGMIIETDPSGKVFKPIDGLLYDKKFEGMSAEEVYDILIKDREFVKRMHDLFKQGKTVTIDDHSVWNGVTHQDTAQGSEATGDARVGFSEGSYEDWKGRVVQAAQVAASNQRGNVPALIKRLVSELIQPQKNWREVLAEFIQQEIADYGWNPYDHRMYGISDLVGDDVIVPDFSETVDVVNDIVFAIDTSGSIGDKEIKVFLSEAVGCVNQYGGRIRGKLIYCDAAIGGVYDLEDVVNSVPRGGGGTDFRPVFQWVADNLPECVGVVYLTDMYGVFPETAPRYPVLWITGTNEVNPPWGRIVKIEV